MLQLRNTPIPEMARDMRCLLLTTKPSLLQKHILLWAADQHIPKAQSQRAKQCLTETLASPICFRLKDLAVNGADLLEIGIKKGPRIGVILHTLLQMTAAEILPNQRELLLQEAKVLSVKPLPLRQIRPLFVLRISKYDFLFFRHDSPRSFFVSTSYAGEGFSIPAILYVAGQFVGPMQTRVHCLQNNTAQVSALKHIQSTLGCPTGRSHRTNQICRLDFSLGD